MTELGGSQQMLIIPSAQISIGPRDACFDANGTELGIYVEGDSRSVRVFHEPSEVAFEIGFDGNLIGPPGRALRFEDTLRQSPPFIEQDDGGIAGFLLDDGVGLIAVENGVLSTVKTIRSSQGSGGGCFTLPASVDLLVVPVRQVPLSGITFPLPTPLYVAPAPEAAP